MALPAIPLGSLPGLHGDLNERPKERTSIPLRMYIISVFPHQMNVGAKVPKRDSDND